MKQLTITAIAILFSATTILAERGSFRDRSENWLQNTNTEETSGNLRGAIGSGDEAAGDLSVPVGISWTVVLALSGLYAVARKKKLQ